MRRRSWVVALAVVAACQGGSASKLDTLSGSGSGSAAVGSGSAGSGSAGKKPPRPKLEQVPPPPELKQPPGDAITTKSGLVYKIVVANGSGAQPGRNDTVQIELVGWSQATGATFNATPAGKPQQMPLANASPGFVEALMLMHQGETALVWIPPALGYVRAPTTGTPDTLVYRIALAGITAAPVVPADVAAAPKTALTAPGGMKYVVVKPASATGDKPRAFDTVSFDFTGWDAEGRMVQTTETAKRQQTSPVYKLPEAFAEAISVMTGAGERVRLWTTVAQLGAAAKALGVPTTPLTFELELKEIKKGVEPPKPPADVAKPPADAKLTPKQVAYKVLTAAKAGAAHVTATDRVKLHFTGWKASDGKMFDSTVARDEPMTVRVASPPVSGWTEVLPLMAVGDRWRVWVPAELAYQNVPGRPQGMLVFEIEVLEILPPAPAAPPKRP